MHTCILGAADEGICPLYEHSEGFDICSLKPTSNTQIAALRPILCLTGYGDLSPTLSSSFRYTLSDILSDRVWRFEARDLNPTLLNPFATLRLTYV
jgi:hypothetical protein